MKVTKLTHACLLVEEGHRQLLIDPGIFTKDIPKLKNLSAVFITHLHPDHIDEEYLKELHKSQPQVPIYSSPEVAKTYPSIKFQEIIESQTIHIDSFTVDCVITDHAIIHNDIPKISNLAITINNNLFYPGDSFYKPKKDVATLACPISAPWLKISEVIDYIKTVKPTTVFPTHNALLSEAGQSVYYRLTKSACESVNAEWTEVQPKESIDI